ncbi:hypothetical protein D3C86_1906040 [compost metagenome]
MRHSRARVKGTISSAAKKFGSVWLDPRVRVPRPSTLLSCPWVVAYRASRAAIPPPRIQARKDVWRWGRARGAAVASR